MDGHVIRHDPDKPKDEVFIPARNKDVKWEEETVVPERPKVGVAFSTSSSGN